MYPSRRDFLSDVMASVSYGAIFSVAPDLIRSGEDQMQVTAVQDIVSHVRAVIDLSGDYKRRRAAGDENASLRASISEHLDEVLSRMMRLVPDLPSVEEVRAVMNRKPDASVISEERLAAATSGAVVIAVMRDLFQTHRIAFDKKAVKNLPAFVSRYNNIMSMAA